MSALSAIVNRCACCHGDPMKIYVERVTKLKATWSPEGDDLILSAAEDRGVIQHGPDGVSWYCPDCVKKMKEKNFTNWMESLL
jgi:hypothetical protein